MRLVPAVLRRRRGSVAWLVGIVALGVALAAIAFWPIAAGPRDGRGGSLVGAEAPELRATGLDGVAWQLDRSDERITWVNFWATSCEPCRTEMPAMDRLAEAYGDRLVVLGVDWGEERGAVADFVGRYEIGYPILLDPTLENYYRWATADGLPRHYFVREGRVVREVIGPLDPGEMVVLLEELIGPVEAG